MHKSQGTHMYTNIHRDTSSTSACKKETGKHTCTNTQTGLVPENRQTWTGPHIQILYTRAQTRTGAHTQTYTCARVKSTRADGPLDSCEPGGPSSTSHTPCREGGRRPALEDSALEPSAGDARNRLPGPLALEQRGPGLGVRRAGR